MIMKISFNKKKKYDLFIFYFDPYFFSIKFNFAKSIFNLKPKYSFFLCT